MPTDQECPDAADVGGGNMTTVSKTSGLDTASNPLSSVKDGSLKTADNVVIRCNNILEPRRGQFLESNAFGASDSRARAIAYFAGGRVVSSVNAGAYSVSYGTTTYTNVASLTPPDATTLRMKFVQGAQSLYFNTTVGQYALASLTSTPRKAGVPKPLGGLLGGLSGPPAVADSWLASNSAVAYRAAFGYKDANGVTRVSEPSGRLVVVNPADSSSVAGQMTRATNVVTVVTSTAHGLRENDTFNISTDAGDPTFTAGPWTVNTVISTTSFTYNQTAANATTTAAHTISTGLQQTYFAFYIPSSITTDYFVRIYRTVTASAASIDPGDEHFLVYERQVTATDISNTYIEYTDATPEGALSTIPLVTNELTGDGAGYYSSPPIAKDVASWNERVWYANTTGPHRYSLQMIGVGSPSGVQNNDTVTIDGFTFTATTGSTTSSNFHITTTLAPQDNVKDTTNELLESIAIKNNAGTLGCGAFYASGVNDPAGKIQLEDLDLGGSTFYVGASRPGSWSPVLPQSFSVTAASTSRTGSTVTVTTGANHGFAVGQSVYLSSNSADANFPVGVKTVVTTPTATTFTYTEAGSAATLSGTYVVFRATQFSANDAFVNRVFYSKVGEPEAVPLFNYVDVGGRNKAILRIVPSREKLFVFKEDAIYTISGDAPNLRVDLLDNTTWLMAPDSAVAANNQIYALTNQGFVSVSDGGVAIISRPIEDQINTSFTDPVSRVPLAKATVWGAAYESERSVLWGLTDTNSTSTSVSSQIYVYNFLTNSWTRWPLSRYFAAVNPATDKLYLAAPDSNKLYGERKSFTSGDYYDETFTVTATATSGMTVTLSSASGVSVGDVISNNLATTWGRISSVDGNVLTLSYLTPGAAISDFGANCLIYTAFQVTIEYNPVAAAPGDGKQASSVTYHFNKVNIYDFDSTVRTELSTTATNTSLTTPGFALSSGVDPSEMINLRVFIPLEKQRASFFRVGLSVREAIAMWQLNGFTLEDRNVSSRNSR